MMEFGFGLVVGLGVAGLLALMWALCRLSAQFARTEEVRTETRRLIYIGEDADGNPIFYPKAVPDDGAQTADE